MARGVTSNGLELEEERGVAEWKSEETESDIQSVVRVVEYYSVMDTIKYSFCYSTTVFHCNIKVYL